MKKYSFTQKNLFQKVCLFLSVVFILIGIAGFIFYSNGCTGFRPGLNCVDRAIAASEVWRRHHPGDKITVVVGKYGDEYHVEPVADGLWIRFNYDMSDFLLLSESEMTCQVFDGPVKKYSYDVFREASDHHRILTPGILDIYAAAMERGL